jgi:hypothetical protein
VAVGLAARGEHADGLLAAVAERTPRVRLQRREILFRHLDKRLQALAGRSGGLSLY